MYSKKSVSEKSESKSNTTSVTKTKFVWKDSKGVEHPIHVTSNGNCFVYRISAKTGKEYKNYLGPDVSIPICKELGIEYKGKQKVKQM